MRYYCYICKKDITPGEFSYSKDKFGRPLCREHQEVERRKQGSPMQVEERPGERTVLEAVAPESEEGIDSGETENEAAPKSRWKSLFAKMGKGIVKGVRGIAHSIEERSKMRKWKTAILRQMTMRQLEQFCFEQGVSTTKNVYEGADEDDDALFSVREVKCSRGGLVSRLKDKLPLDTIISFAERNRIPIREILIDRDRTKAHWEERDLAEKIKESGSNTFLLELEKAILKFTPMRRYDKELYYQDMLAGFLHREFPDTKIEVPRGTTRPDIVVKGIAIEIKGPTNARELETIASKCVRYLQYFPKGLICVLFDVAVTRQYYDDWAKGLKKVFSNVIIMEKMSP